MRSSPHSPEFLCPPLTRHTPREPSSKENGPLPHDKTEVCLVATRGSSSRRSWFFRQASRSPREHVLPRTPFQKRRRPLVVDMQQSTSHYSYIGTPILKISVSSLTRNSTLGGFE